MGIGKTFAEVLAKLIGPDGRDNLQQLDTDIAADHAVLKDCETQRTWLKSQMSAAELDNDLETAEKIDEEVRRLDRLERGAKARLPVLEQRRKTALDIKRTEAITAAIEQNRAAYLAVRATLISLAAANAEAIKLAERLRAEFGERDAAVHFPRAAFVGIPLPDLVDLWLRDMNAQFGSVAEPASPQLKPVAAPSGPTARAVPMVSNGNRSVSLADVAPIVPKSKRRPLPKPVEGGVRITLLRGGVELPGGASSVAGDVVTVEADVASSLLRSGAADRTEIANVD